MNKTANNTIFLLRRNGNDNNKTIVKTFSAENDGRRPKRALNRFLDLVLGDTEHELYTAASQGDLSYISGHIKLVQLAVQTKVIL